MPLDPSQFSRNEAWILFRLNDAPVRTESDGDFDAMAIMEITSRMIFGMELVPLAEQQLSELHSRRLLTASAKQAGGRPAYLYVASEQEAEQLTIAAAAMGVTVRRVPESDLAAITREAREGFAAHISGGRAQ